MAQEKGYRSYDQLMRLPIRKRTLEELEHQVDLAKVTANAMLGQQNEH